MTHHTITEALATALEEASATLQRLCDWGGPGHDRHDTSWRGVAGCEAAKARAKLAAYRAQQAAPAAAEGQGQGLVPLTEEQIGEMEADAWSDCEDTSWTAVIYFARAVERACAEAWGVKLASDKTASEGAAYRRAHPRPAQATVKESLSVQPAQREAVAWREHVEQRIRNWRQRTMNKSGDHLAIDDFMGQESIDDLVDYVCDEWEDPAAGMAPAQGEAVATVKGMPFAEAKKIILELPADAVRGLAISLLIQNGLLEKYGTHPAAGMAGQGLTEQQMAVVRFLAGEDTLRGVWFDERPEGAPRYWWRSDLWDAFGIHPASDKTAGSGEVSA